MKPGFGGEPDKRPHPVPFIPTVSEATLSSRTFSEVMYQFLPDGSCGDVFKFSVGTS